MTTTQPTIVLVPGGYHLPSHFTPFTSYIRSRNHAIHTIDLPSNLITTNPSLSAPFPTTFDADVHAITTTLTTLASTGVSIILVVHSYGGIPGATATRCLLATDRQRAGLPGGVVHIVYLASFVVPLGSSLLALAGGDISGTNALSADGRTAVPVNPADTLFHDVADEGEVARLVGLLSPMSVDAFKGQVGFEAWREVSGTYVVCRDDRALPADWQRGMVEACRKTLKEDGKEGDAWLRIVEMEGGHSPFAARADELGDVVIRIAGEFV